MSRASFLEGFHAGFGQQGGYDRLGSGVARRAWGGRFYDPQTDPMFQREYQQALETGMPALQQNVQEKYGQFFEGEDGTQLFPSDPATLYGMDRQQFTQQLAQAAMSGHEIPEEILTDYKGAFGEDITPLIEMFTPPAPEVQEGEGRLSFEELIDQGYVPEEFIQEYIDAGYITIPLENYQGFYDVRSPVGEEETTLGYDEFISGLRQAQQVGTPGAYSSFWQEYGHLAPEGYTLEDYMPQTEEETDTRTFDDFMDAYQQAQRLGTPAAQSFFMGEFSDMLPEDMTTEQLFPGEQITGETTGFLPEWFETNRYLGETPDGRPIMETIAGGRLTIDPETGSPVNWTGEVISPQEDDTVIEDVGKLMWMYGIDEEFVKEFVGRSLPLVEARRIIDLHTGPQTDLDPMQLYLYDRFNIEPPAHETGRDLSGYGEFYERNRQPTQEELDQMAAFEQDTGVPFDVAMQGFITRLNQGRTQDISAGDIQQQQREDQIRGTMDTLRQRSIDDYRAGIDDTTPPATEEPTDESERSFMEGLRGRFPSPEIGDDTFWQNLRQMIEVQSQPITEMMSGIRQDPSVLWQGFTGGVEDTSDIDMTGEPDAITGGRPMSEVTQFAAERHPDLSPHEIAEKYEQATEEERQRFLEQTGVPLDTVIEELRGMEIGEQEDYEQIGEMDIDIPGGRDLLGKALGIDAGGLTDVTRAGLGISPGQTEQMRNLQESMQGATEGLRGFYDTLAGIGRREEEPETIDTEFERVAGVRGIEPLLQGVFNAEGGRGIERWYGTTGIETNVQNIGREFGRSRNQEYFENLINQMGIDNNTLQQLRQLRGSTDAIQQGLEEEFELYTKAASATTLTWYMQQWLNQKGYSDDTDIVDLSPEEQEELIEYIGLRYAPYNDEFTEKFAEEYGLTDIRTPYDIHRKGLTDEFEDFVKRTYNQPGGIESQFRLREEQVNPWWVANAIRFFKEANETQPGRVDAAELDEPIGPDEPAEGQQDELGMPQGLYEELFGTRTRAGLSLDQQQEEETVTEQPTSYTVQQGDTISHIAQNHGVSTQELLNYNNLAEDDIIYPGQEIQIPTGETEETTVTEEETGETQQETYTVQSGDTLSQIAQQFNISVQELMELNDIDDADTIFVGEELIIP